MTMKHSYLEVTYRNGRPLGAYYYLPRHEGDASVRTESVGEVRPEDLAPLAAA